jgi:hypothetical protein
MTFVYNSISLSTKDRLTIANLLALFSSRLNAKWVPATRNDATPTHLVLVDVDQPDGPERWDSAPPQARIAITSGDQRPNLPFVSRPIRAYGPNGVIVVFNAVAKAWTSPSTNPSSDREITAPREASAREAAPREASPREAVTREAPIMRMAGRLDTIPAPVKTPTVRVAPPPTPPPAPPAASSAAAPAAPRASVKWGPPEVIVLPQIFRMPGGHLHFLAGRMPGELAEAPPASVETEVPKPEAAAQAFEIPSPQRTWIAPPPVTEEPGLLDQMPLAHRPGSLMEVQPVVESELSAEADADAGAAEEEIAAEFSNVEDDASLEVLAQAVTDAALEKSAESIEDADADWWETSAPEPEPEPEPVAAVQKLVENPGGGLLSVLKAIKAAGTPAVIEITGLPAMCVVPERNVYFSTAPAARIDQAVSTHAEASWRPCPSEAAARELSGTEQSRQMSLEQLLWTVSLLTEDAAAMSLADVAVRLRRWPPLTESRGRSKYVRYSTLLAGAQATPREIAEITGDPIEDVVAFVNACFRMNLLEEAGFAKAPSPTTRTAGAGILREMIEQLTPPKI